VERLTGKRVVSPLVAVPALLLLFASTRTWLTGHATDPLLGGEVSASGAQLAPGVVALAAVCLVALVALLSGGPRVRRTSAVVIVLAAAAAAALTIWPLTDAQAGLGRVAAGTLGRTGTVATTAAATSWAWVAVVAAVALVLAALLAYAATGSWAGLSSRFDAPGEVATGADPGIRRTPWDELSEGRDPTLAPKQEERPVDGGMT
jgi:glucan phosphoethanolaminetransferase (alkaline phosphatase superfamily)